MQYVNFVAYLATVYAVGVFVRYWQVETSLFERGKWLQDSAYEIIFWPMRLLEKLAERFRL